MGSNHYFAGYVGKQIRRFRELERLSQEDLGARVYLDQSIISKYENGVRPITVQRLCEISDALNRHPGDFFSEIEL